MGILVGMTKMPASRGTVLHGGGWGAQDFQAGLMLRNTDGLWASKREHAIEDMDGDRDLGILTGNRSANATRCQ